MSGKNGRPKSNGMSDINSRHKSAAEIIGICHRKNATAACNGAKGSLYYLKKIVFKELPRMKIFGLRIELIHYKQCRFGKTSFREIRRKMFRRVRHPTQSFRRGLLTIRKKYRA